MDDQTEMIKQAQEWINEVEDAYMDGGYASGDGPPAPLDEMKYLVAEVARLREGIRAHHRGVLQASDEADRIAVERRLWALLDRGPRDTASGR